MTKTSKLLASFQKGEALTAKQIKARFGLANPAEAVRVLRTEGYAIYSNETKMSDGKVATKNRIGKPSRAMVAAAAEYAGATVFS